MMNSEHVLPRFSRKDVAKDSCEMLDGDAARRKSSGLRYGVQLRYLPNLAYYSNTEAVNTGTRTAWHASDSSTRLTNASMKYRHIKHPY